MVKKLFTLERSNNPIRQMAHWWKQTHYFIKLKTVKITSEQKPLKLKLKKITLIMQATAVLVQGTAI